MSGGLVNIRDRVAAVGGQLLVGSAPGTGTRLVVDLPVDSPARPAPEPVPPLEHARA